MTTVRQQETYPLEPWLLVDRLGAEEFLKDKPVGCYLFRKDEYAALLEKMLPQPVTCFTLTRVEEGGRISDHTLVCKEERWLIYNDDPSLSGPFYETIEELLRWMMRHF